MWIVLLSEALPQLFCLRADLAQPLGIGFDDNAVAEDVKDGLQGPLLL
jgi:hypothetical protein